MSPAVAYLEAHRRIDQLTREISENDITHAARLVARAAVLQLHEHLSSAELKTWVNDIGRELGA